MLCADNSRMQFRIYRFFRKLTGLIFQPSPRPTNPSHPALPSGSFLKGVNAPSPTIIKPQQATEKVSVGTPLYPGTSQEGLIM